MRFWDASGVSLKPLYKLGTASIFQTDCEHNDSLNQAGEEEWPPFRKVRSPGGDGTLLWDPSSPLPPPALGVGKHGAGHGGCTRWSRPGCTLVTCPLRAQLPCDALWGHKGRLFHVPGLVGLPQRGGGELGGAWGQTFPGRDARSSPCAAAGTRQPVGGM